MSIHCYTAVKVPGSSPTGADSQLFSSDFPRLHFPLKPMTTQYVHIDKLTQSADRTVSSFVDSSAQHRENEAEPDSKEKIIFMYVPVLLLEAGKQKKICFPSLNSVRFVTTVSVRCLVVTTETTKYLARGPRLVLRHVVSIIT